MEEVGSKDTKMRNPYWDELDDKGKIERMRGIIKSMTSELENMRGLIDKLKAHNHTSLGLVIPLEHHRYEIGRIQGDGKYF